jgi:hypothetical protein
LSQLISSNAPQFFYNSPICTDVSWPNRTQEIKNILPAEDSDFAPTRGEREDAGDLGKETPILEQSILMGNITLVRMRRNQDDG